MWYLAKIINTKSCGSIVEAYEIHLELSFATCVAMNLAFVRTIVFYVVVPQIEHMEAIILLVWSSYRWGSYLLPHNTSLMYLFILHGWNGWRKHWLRCRVLPSGLWYKEKSTHMLRSFYKSVNILNLGMKLSNFWIWGLVFCVVHKDLLWRDCCNAMNWSWERYKVVFAVKTGSLYSIRSLHLIC